MCFLRFSKSLLFQENGYLIFSQPPRLPPTASTINGFLRWKAPPASGFGKVFKNPFKFLDVKLLTFFPSIQKRWDTNAKHSFWCQRTRFSPAAPIKKGRNLTWGDGAETRNNFKRRKKYDASNFAVFPEQGPGSHSGTRKMHPAENKRADGTP